MRYEYIRPPSAVVETALICNLKSSVMHDRVVLGLNSRHLTVSPCPSQLGHASQASYHVPAAISLETILLLFIKYQKVLVYHISNVFQMYI